ncbi:hypothetical protein [Prochlorococcus sp. MIT 1303]|uniref:hypothetical protein n=1 Tax=Prochlorococcus sp. MIT 1303 TaxID=1723647 RepID=UPI0007B3911C|nr:hypothetical protein [Prochlorococcus sp. MIT 1303]KZR61788.1 hypothetical protein PMIT1303_01988 [Prochlorococcus sp. MIT 1303]
MAPISIDRLIPELCRWPGDLAANRDHPSRGPFLRRERQRLLYRYRLVRVLQAMGWKRPPIHLLYPLRNLTGLVPLDGVTLSAAHSLLTQINRAALSSLHYNLELNKNGQGPVLPVITSCRHRLRNAQAAQEAFQSQKVHGILKPLIVVGQKYQADWAIDYDPHLHLLRISVDDAYEGLPAKVVSMIALIALLPDPPLLLKLDDDARPGNLKQLKSLASRLNQPTPIAAGYPIVTPTPLDLDRAWHLGKSRRANKRIFCSIGTREWLSGGAGYILNTSAVRLINEFWLHTWDFVNTMLYEDVCLSMLLQAGDVQFQWLRHPGELGLQSERQEEVDQGQWSVPETFFHQHHDYQT